MLKWFSRLGVVIGPVLWLALMIAAAAVRAADIDAGPIWSDMDAKGKCPSVCSAAGGAGTATG
jgi:hypothetical protein